MEDKKQSSTSAHNVNGESKCPFTGGASEHSAGGGTFQPRLGAQSVEFENSPVTLFLGLSEGENNSTTPREFRNLDLNGR